MIHRRLRERLLQTARSFDHSHENKKMEKKTAKHFGKISSEENFLLFTFFNAFWDTVSNGATIIGELTTGELTFSIFAGENGI